jgi:hypothetical protein
MRLRAISWCHCRPFAAAVNLTGVDINDPKRPGTAHQALVVR